MAVVRLKGAAAGDFIAADMVRIYGAEGARERSCGEMREAVEREIARRKAAVLAAHDALTQADRREAAERRSQTERAARDRL